MEQSFFHHESLSHQSITRPITLSLSLFLSLSLSLSLHLHLHLTPSRININIKARVPGLGGLLDARQRGTLFSHQRNKRNQRNHKNQRNSQILNTEMLCRYRSRTLTPWRKSPSPRARYASFVSTRSPQRSNYYYIRTQTPHHQSSITGHRRNGADGAGGRRGPPTRLRAPERPHGAMGRGTLL
jgi:hypothetical protein